MNIEHLGLFHGFTKSGTPQNKKPCARRREAERSSASASGDPAMVFGFRMASILSLGSRAPCPLCPAAGLLLDIRMGHDLSASCPCTSPASRTAKRRRSIDD